MIDEIFDRTYQAGRAEFHAGIDRGLARLGGGLTREIGRTFRLFHRIQWSAPWAVKPSGGRANRRGSGLA